VVLPAIKDQILSDLDRLAPEEQRRAAELVHGLVPHVEVPHVEVPCFSRKILSSDPV
jgi:hypothetical protein